MTFKVLCAVLVISLAYVSEAVFFRDRFPGKTLADLAECKDKHAVTGYDLVIPSKNKYGTKHGVACAKYCLKQRLAGERKDIEKLKNIVASAFSHTRECYCLSGGTAKYTPTTLQTTGCIFKAAEPTTCEPAITTLINGKVECTDSNDEGSVCILTCDDGYTCGDATLHVHESTCTNGEWDSKPVEECIPISCPAESLELTEGVESVNCENGKSGKDTDWLSRCTFTCKDGYSFENEKKQMIRCVGDGDHSDGFGRWYGDVPKCIKDDNNDGLIPGKTCWKEGEQFMGTTVSTTASGKTCDTWSHDFNAWHMYDDNGDYAKSMYLASYYDIKDETAGNYCRNYKEDPNGPYCFVGAEYIYYEDVYQEINTHGNILTETDHFEYCDIPKCP